MNVLDDSIHQLFSQVLFSEGHVFENNVFPKSSGFNDNGKYRLDGEIGLLGLRHPLKIRSSLTAALSPYTFASRKNVAELYKEIQEFFSKHLGSAHIGQFISNSSLAFAPGRYANFFSEIDFNLLEKGSINVEGIFTFAFSLSKNKPNLSPSLNMSENDYLYNKSILRLLSEGQFYEGANLISHREQEIQAQLDGCENVSCKGMTIIINNINLPQNVMMKNNTAILPLYFEEGDLKSLIKIIKESSCS